MDRVVPYLSCGQEHGIEHGIEHAGIERGTATAKTEFVPCT